MNQTGGAHLKDEIENKITALKDKLRESKKREAILRQELNREKQITAALKHQLESKGQINGDYHAQQLQTHSPTTEPDVMSLSMQNAALKTKVADLNRQLEECSKLGKGVDRPLAHSTDCPLSTSAPRYNELAMHQLMARYEAALKESYQMKLSLREAKQEYERVIHGLLSDLKGCRSRKRDKKRQLR